jgi:hypothetical protein
VIVVCPGFMARDWERDLLIAYGETAEKHKVRLLDV